MKKVWKPILYPAAQKDLDVQRGYRVNVYTTSPTSVHVNPNYSEVEADTAVEVALPSLRIPHKHNGKDSLL